MEMELQTCMLLCTSQAVSLLMTFQTQCLSMRRYNEMSKDISFLQAQQLYTHCNTNLKESKLQPSFKQYPEMRSTSLSDVMSKHEKKLNTTKRYPTS